MDTCKDSDHYWFYPGDSNRDIRMCYNYGRKEEKMGIAQVAGFDLEKHP